MHNFCKPKQNKKQEFENKNRIKKERKKIYKQSKLNSMLQEINKLKLNKIEKL